MVDLKKEVKYVKGVGPNKAIILNRLGIQTLGDLITYFPRDYEDRNKPKKLAEVIDGQEALVEAKVSSSVTQIPNGRKNMKIFKMLIQDETATAIVTWFNNKYAKDIFKVGQIYSFYGKYTVKQGKIEIRNPIFDKQGRKKNTGKIIPIYPATYSMSSNNLRNIIENGLELVDHRLQETLPEALLKEYNLEEINKAIHQIHFPENFDSFKIARKRFVFEELLGTQLALLSLRYANSKDICGISYSKEVHMSDVINDLPFHLTKAQLRVLEEIDNDLEKEKPMNRLLQGDVGSRKNNCKYGCCL